jgi:hypothetical protein
MATSKDLPLRVSVTVLIPGGAAGTVIVIGVSDEGVISTPPAVNRIVMVIVPAVDPLWKLIGGIAVVSWAGMSTEKVVVPFENSTVGSTTVIGGNGVKARVSVAVMGTGYGFTDSVIGDCCVAPMVVGPVALTITGGATTEKF